MRQSATGEKALGGADARRLGGPFVRRWRLRKHGRCQPERRCQVRLPIGSAQVYPRIEVEEEDAAGGRPSTPSLTKQT